MATTVHNTHPQQQGGDHPGSQPSGKKAAVRAPLAHSRRFHQRLLYFLRHPIDALWGWLSSVRTAILLIAAIVLICFIGIYFAQAPGEVLNDPTSYAAWREQNALPHYGSLTLIYDWLQFFTIFSSWYFKLLLTILSLSIVVCTLNRAPAIWHNFAHPLIRRSEKFYQHALERGTFSHPNAVTWTRTALRRRHYRVRSTIVMKEEEHGEQSEVIYLYVNKHSWATLSTFVFHAALVTLLMAGAVSQWHGFDTNSPVRRFLPAPLLSMSDALAGFTFDQALPNGQSAIVYLRGTPHNISFRANHFTATFDPTTGLATDYVTDLSVYQDGELVAQSDHLRVNDPLAYGGVIFHQSSLIASAHITLRDQQHNVIFNEAVVLDQTDNSQPGVQIDYARDLPISGSSFLLSVLFPHDPGQQLAQVPHPSLLIGIGPAGQNPQLSRLTAGQSTAAHGQGWTITLNSASEATVLLVTKDASSLVIWPAAIMLLLSLCITFYLPQKRIWIRIEGTQVQMAALREHYTTIRTDLLALAKEAHKEQESG